MDGDFYTETYSYREGRIFLYKRPKLLSKRNNDEIIYDIQPTH